MFMLRKTHEAEMAQAEKLISDTIDRAQSNYDLNQRALDAERSITASLRAEIEVMRPDYELGKKRRTQYEKDNAKRKAARAGK